LSTCPSGLNNRRVRANRLGAQDGQAAIEWLGAIAVVAAILVTILSLGLPGQIGPSVSRLVQNVFNASAQPVPGGTSPSNPSVPPAGVTSLRDAHGNLWTWMSGGPQGPHWEVTGQNGSVSEVSPQGTLLSGPSLGAIGFPIVKVTQQGNRTLVETLDGKVYTLQSKPDKGPDQTDVQDVADQILSTREGVGNVSFVKRSPAEPRPDLVTYDSLKPGSTLHFVEVKNLSVDDDGQLNARTGAGNILDAMQRQGADEVVVVIDTPPDPNSMLSVIQRTNQLLASKGVSGTVTIAVRESGDIGLGALHEAWTGKLGAGVSSDDVDSLDNGEASAKDDQPGDEEAGEPAPENPVLGDGGGDGDGDGGDGIGFGGE
jgi:hypothetical protein